MKLIIAIVNNDDSSTVQSALTEGGFFVTKLATSGGFLKKGNTTFFIGTNDDKVDPALEIIKAHARKRVEKEPTVPPTEMGEFFTPIIDDVLVGGATVFVVDVYSFEKIQKTAQAVFCFVLMYSINIDVEQGLCYDMKIKQGQ